jgi:hypothetical protein
MPKKKTLMKSLVGQLQSERSRLQSELQAVSAALSAFGKAYMKGGKSGFRRKHAISAAGRKRIAAAQRARWAKVRAAARKPARNRPSLVK